MKMSPKRRNRNKGMWDILPSSLHSQQNQQSNSYANKHLALQCLPEPVLSSFIPQHGLHSTKPNKVH